MRTVKAILDIVNKLGPQRLVAMGAVTLALVGFFAAGEIARANLYGYTGVLTAFAA